MKIVHVSAKAPYNDYWGYQENLLPKYHEKGGHDVWVLTTNTEWDNNIVKKTECREYTLSDGVRIKRFMKKNYINETITEVISKIDIYKELCEIKPDFIFFHELMSLTVFEAIKYKKKINSECIIVQDNHLDYNNGRIVNSSKDKLIRKYFRILNRISQKYVDKVYGVTPCRKTYAEDYFGISPQKTDVLIMGADDEKINFNKKEEIRNKIRKEYSIKPDEFLIVTGGKITFEKKIHILAEAVKEKEKVKMLVFGKVDTKFQEEYDRSINENVINIGWVDADKVYDYFFAADLIVFPGSHSVLWEQACAAKVPCVFKLINGMEHVNNGGNAELITDVTVDKLSEIIDSLHFTDKYYKMKKAAESSKTDIYLYSSIAKKSLEMVE